MRLSALIRQRYFVMLFVISSVVLGTFTFVIYRQSQSVAYHDEWVLHSYEVLRIARRLVTDIVDQDTSQRAYLFTGDKKSLDAFETSRKKAAVDLDNLKKLTADNGRQNEVVRSIDRQMGLHELLLKQQIDFYTKAKRFGRVRVQDLEDSRNVVSVSRSMLEAFINQELGLLNERRARQASEQSDYLLTLVLGCGVALAGLLLTFYLVAIMTERSEKIEAHSRTVEESYALLLQGIKDGMYDYNPVTGKVIYSQTYKQMLGYGDDWPLGDNIDDFNTLLHPEDQDSTWNEIRRFERREVPVFAHVFRLRHKNGTWKWMLSRGVGVWDTRGQLKRMVGLNTDITEQKNREEDLRTLNNDLESFTYIASHDLRAPLVNLKGFARELEHAVERIEPIIEEMKQGLDEQKVRDIHESLEVDIPEALGYIRSSVERMDTLTTSIVELSRIGKREYSMAPVDTHSLVSRVLDTLSYEIKEKEIDVQIEGKLPVVISDAAALEQIFANILENAVKYMDNNRPGQITVSARPSYYETEFFIRDNGRGIAESDHSKVFDVFRRASNSGEVRGSGMGMAFVKATVRKIGGRIGFESELGRGTTFHFTVPVRTHKEDL